MITYQDFSKEWDTGDMKRIAAYIQKAINEHISNPAVQLAETADKYDKHQNSGIDDFYAAYGEMQRKLKILNQDARKPESIKSNFFRRLNTQRNTYSLGNGVSFAADGEKDTVKERLGEDFDTALRDAGYKALIHGLSFGFWNQDKLIVFPLTQCVPLWDEETNALRACIRFWRLQPDKPMFAVLYTEDGYMKFRTGADNHKNDFVPMQDNLAPYRVRVEHTEAGGDEIIGTDNYSALPIVPLWGSTLHQSTLVGMKAQIDNYDLVLSGFASNVQDCAEIYWLVENYGGMSDEDLQDFLRKINIDHVANADTSENGKITPYTQEIPVTARETLLMRLHSQIYEDFGGLDVHAVDASSTNDHLAAAYQPMDENADDFEYQIITFIRQILKIAGIEEAVPLFKRNRIANVKEQVELVMMEAPYLDDATIIDLLPNITPDQKEQILAARQGEQAAMMEDAPAEDETEENAEGN